MSESWYVVYTKRYQEMKLEEYFMSFSSDRSLGYQSYLPLTNEVKTWSDRKKVIQLPLFSNYLFVKHDESGFNNVKRMPGFVEYVRFGGYPSVIPEEQIFMIKKILEADKFAMSKTQSLIKGQRVRIIKGPMEGLEGVLIKDQLNLKVAIELEHLKRSLQVSVPINNIFKI
jgi:transcription antitermination factor NusG